MKIAISTIVDYNNYGNRLQNYALQSVLSSLGHEVETIRNTTKNKLPLQVVILMRLTGYKRKVNKLVSLIKKGTLIQYAKKKINQKTNLKFNNNNLLNSQHSNLRAENFRKFTRDNIKETEIELDNFIEDYTYFNRFDCFVIGSDQVWNYEFDKFSNLAFVPFRKPSQKVISYAASFGVSDIPFYFQKTYKRGLNKIDSISVREFEGKTIVESISDKKCSVVLDPTMLLQRKEWDNIANQSKVQLVGKYVVVYILGNLSSKENELIYSFAQKRDAKIVRLSDPNDNFGWNLGPSDFVKLIKNSEGVFTDSFHASIFSIIFHKSFTVFERHSHHKSMSSRITTLLSEFGLSERLFNDRLNVDEKINYQLVEKILSRRREESLSFLTNALKSNI